MPRFLIALLAMLVLQCGCAPRSPAGGSDDAEKKKWENAGWTFLEVVGTQVGNAEYASHISSDTARSVSAFAFDGSQRLQREYIQTDRLYLIVTMAERSGKTYALVFQKERKAKQTHQRNPEDRPLSAYSACHHSTATYQIRPPRTRACPLAQTSSRVEIYS